MVPTGAGHFEETGSAEEKIVPTLDQDLSRDEIARLVREYERQMKEAYSSHSRNYLTAHGQS